MATNEAQLMEMERLMRSAPQPGGLDRTGIDMGEGVAVTKTSVKSAGHVVMWNTDTHESSVFNMNAIRTKLGEMFPADYENPLKRGLPAWTATAPTEEPWHGVATCPLHSSRPEREEYDRFGYPRCTRVNLPNEMEAQQHLKKKHPQTWRMMNESREQAERVAQAEDREINRLILASLAGVTLEEKAHPVPTNVEEPQVTETAEVLHVHRYGKRMGAPCNVSGCSAVRQVEFQSRKKRK